MAQGIIRLEAGNADGTNSVPIESSPGRYLVPKPPSAPTVKFTASVRHIRAGKPLVRLSFACVTVVLAAACAQVFSRNASANFRADTSKVTICGNQNDASGAIIERWNGLVDDVQLYSRALTATEIASLAK
jgi:hypothetical protein